MRVTPTICVIGLTIVASALPQTSSLAQVSSQGLGTVVGTVADAQGRVLPGALIRLSGTRYAVHVDSTGRYRLTDIPAGSYFIHVVKLGYEGDSSSVTINGDAVTDHPIMLRASAALLSGVLVTAERLGESQASALDRRQSAPNLVNVLAGDAIRELPNLNAAEAAGRIPGVTTERDEGEGKFVQIRGTEPRLSNVTINGAHVPGTGGGNRIPKLDDVPSDILAAIEVSKTLTAEQDADAIGGSINLVTKTPEGQPHGYVSGQFGQMMLLNRNQSQGGFAFGGRFGSDERLGILLGGSVDHNNRAINDLEPAWNVDSTGRSFPVEWSQRDYLYRRNRYGFGGDVDYRFAGGSTLSLKGLYSYFENFGTTYVNDVSTGVTGSAFGSTGDSVGTGSTGFGTGAEVTREVYDRTPRETMYGFTTGGSTHLGALELKAAGNIAGTMQHEKNYRFNPFVYDGPGGQGLTVSYDASHTNVPTFQYANQGMASASNTAANFMLSNYFTVDGNTNGRDNGGSLDLSMPWMAGSALGSSFLRFGGKVRDEHKDFTSNRASFSPNTAIPLTAGGIGVVDPNYYHAISQAFTLGIVPDAPTLQQYEDTHPSTDRSNASRNALGSFSGSERVYSAYVSNAFTSSPAELYLGLRMENTHSSHLGHVVTKDVNKVVTVREVPGAQTYTDLFPSAQVKFDVGSGTDARVAVTRGIARPDYSLLAPSISGSTDLAARYNPSALSAGNPDLKPQHAWNYDLLVEHFFPSVGVISGGVFYKQITDVILTKRFTYNGPVPDLVGFQGTRPDNGGSGHLLGVEADWQQQLTFLSGLARGLGIDVNYTHVNSSVVVDTTGRKAELLRQSPNLANAALTYAHGSVTARAAWAYQGANLTSYGDGLGDGLGDTYFYAHSQIDASLQYSVTQDVQVQLQGLNLNNAVFGFFQGDRKHDYSIQREYYGRTIYVGMKYGR